MGEERQSATTPDDRPEGHPAHLPWPPKVREYPPNHPARRDEESKEAFNEDWARNDFGDEFVDGLMRKHAQFCGDWWLLALLERCALLAQRRDPERKNINRFCVWESVCALLQQRRVVIHLERTNLTLEFLEDARIRGAHLEHANLSQASLTRAGLSHAHLERAIIRDARLQLAKLIGSHLDHADLRRADVSGADITGARLIGTRGLFGRHRALAHSAPIEEHAAQSAVYARHWDRVPWDLLRVIGGLRIFGVSYFSIAAITLYVGLAREYNVFAAHARDAVKAVQAPPDGALAGLWTRVVAGLPDLPVPGHLGRQLVFTIVLAVAATIYAGACPAEVKEANEVRWTRAMGQPLWEYRSANWSRMSWRYACALCFVVGAAHTLWYLGVRSFNAARYLLFGT